MEKKPYIETSVEFDNSNKCWKVYAWRTEDPDEESTIIAHINLKGELEWKDDEAKANDAVAKDIESFYDGKLFSAKDGGEMAARLLEAFNGYGMEHSEIWDVITQDGITNFGFDKKMIFGNLSLAVGMPGTEDYKIFCVGEEEYKAAEWLVEDITSAVGEEFVIDLNS